MSVSSRNPLRHERTWSERIDEVSPFLFVSPKHVLQLRLRVLLVQAERDRLRRKVCFFKVAALHCRLTQTGQMVEMKHAGYRVLIKRSFWLAILECAGLRRPRSERRSDLPTRRSRAPRIARRRARSSAGAGMRHKSRIGGGSRRPTPVEHLASMSAYPSSRHRQGTIRETPTGSGPSCTRDVDTHSEPRERTAPTRAFPSWP